MRRALLLCCLLACSHAPPPVAAAASEAAWGSLRAEAEAHFARRLELAELDLAIAAWERAVALHPDDHASLAMLARAHYFRAEGHLVFAAGKPGYARELALAADAAERALRARSPEFARLRKLDAPFEDAIAVLGAGDMPLCYWWAQATIMWASTQGLGRTMAVHEAVFRVMETVKTLAPDTWYGGADRYFGLVYAKAPAVAGGDLARARLSFDESLRRAPDFLETWLLLAVIYAREAHDDALYRQALEHVLAAPVDSLPDLLPEQTVAQRKARLLLR